jgi:nucleoside-diphosphate-sugar epimerase
MIKVALLGSTSHIAKGLIVEFLEFRNDSFELYLFARNPSQTREFLSNENRLTPEIKIIEDFEHFSLYTYDVILNCIGFGDPKKLSQAGFDVFTVMERYDNLVLEYLAVHQDTRYINFSSGAAYLSDFSKPVQKESETRITVNDFKKTDYYGLTKLYAQIKHQSMPDLSIVDIRVFGYFSPFIDLGAGFLLCEILNAISNKTKLSTSSQNIVRDYIHPQDLFQMVYLVMTSGKQNTVYDSYSLAPIAKFELLDFYKNHYGLDYVVSDSKDYTSASGAKLNYYSNYHKAKDMGYVPRYSSLECVSLVSQEIFKSQKERH